MRKGLWGVVSSLTLAALVASGLFAASGSTEVASGARQPGTGLLPGGGRVIIIHMDNMHWVDMQRMPAFMNFAMSGTILSGMHTVLPSHTHDDMQAISSGQYPGEVGILNNPPVYRKLWMNNDTGPYWEKNYFGWWNDVFTPVSPAMWSNYANGESVQRLGNSQFGLTTPPWQPFTQKGMNYLSMGSDLTIGDDPIGMYWPDGSYVRYLGATSQYNSHTGVYTTSGSITMHEMPSSLFNDYNQWWGTDTPQNGYPSQFYHYGAPWGVFDPVSDEKNLMKMIADVNPRFVEANIVYTSAHWYPDPGRIPGYDGYPTAITATNQAFADLFADLQSTGELAKDLLIITTDEQDVYQGAMPAYNFMGHESDMGAGEVSANYNPSLVYLNDSSQINTSLTWTVKNVPGIAGIAAWDANKILHEWGTDADRNPDYTLYPEAQVNYISTSRVPSGTVTLNGPNWVHGTLDPQIVTTWALFHGPGIKSGATLNNWESETDILPTEYYYLGMPMGADLSGRPLYEVMLPSALPKAVAQNYGKVKQINDLFEQVNEPNNTLCQDALQISTLGAYAVSMGQDSTPYQNALTQIYQLQVQSTTEAKQVIDVYQNNGTPNAAAMTTAMTDLQNAVNMANQLLQQLRTRAAKQGVMIHNTPPHITATTPAVNLHTWSDEDGMPGDPHNDSATNPNN